MTTADLPVKGLIVALRGQLAAVRGRTKMARGMTNHVIVDALLPQQFGMVSAFEHLALSEDVDDIGILYSG
jgi:hypothetical protein